MSNLQRTIGTALALLAAMPAALAQTQYQVVQAPYAGHAPASAVLIGRGGDMLIQLIGNKRLTGGEMCNPQRCNYINDHSHLHPTLWFAMAHRRSYAGTTRKDGDWWAVRQLQGSNHLIKLTPGTAYGINDMHVTVGRTVDDQPFAYDTSLHILQTLPGNKGAAYAINDAGTIVGTSRLADGEQTRAVSWSGGVLTELGSLPGATHSKAVAINVDGVAVGCSNADGGATPDVAVQFKDGTVTTLGALAAGHPTCATAINGAGVAVGTGEVEAGEHPFVMEGGAIVDLTTRISAQDRGHYALKSAAGISSDGIIAVTAVRVSDSQQVAVWLVPQP